jgi:hypothetical protein
MHNVIVLRAPNNPVFQSEISDSHRSIVEDLSLLGYNVVLISKFLQTFYSRLLSPFSGSKQPPPKCNYTPITKASYPKILSKKSQIYVVLNMFNYLQNGNGGSF